MSYRAFKRLFDVLVSGSGSALTAPLVGAVAASVKLTSRGSPFFVQVRVGRGEQLFRLYKLRTMVPAAERLGPKVTASGDTRITPLGKWLRRTKLDELPQLWNVLLGDMSLVGPRPEVPEYVEHYPEEWRRVFEVRPGITDTASVLFRDEEGLLSAAIDRDAAYRTVVLPAKIQLALGDISEESLAHDFLVLARTVLAVLAPRAFEDHPVLRRVRQEIVALNAAEGEGLITETRTQ